MALENLGRRRSHSVVVLAFADRLNLYLGIVVRITRLLVSLLVCFQSESRTLLRLCNIDRFTAERDVSTFPATLRRVRVRTAHHHSEQPAVSVFTC